MSSSQNKLTPRDWSIVIQISCMFSFSYNLGAVMASRQAQGQESLSVGFAYILMSLATLLIGVVGPSLQLIGSPILLRVSTFCAALGITSVGMAQNRSMLIISLVLAGAGGSTFVSLLSANFATRGNGLRSVLMVHGYSAIPAIGFPALYSVSIWLEIPGAVVHLLLGTVLLTGHLFVAQTSTSSVGYVRPRRRSQPLPRQFWIACSLILLGGIIEVGTASWIGIVVRNRTESREYILPIAVLSVLVGLAIMRILLSRVETRPSLVYRLSLMASVPSVLVITFSQQVVVSLAASVIFGMCVAVCFPFSFASCIKFGSENVDKSTFRTMLASGSVGILGPSIFGLSRHFVGDDFILLTAIPFAFAALIIGSHSSIREVLAVAADGEVVVNSQEITS